MGKKKQLPVQKKQQKRALKALAASEEVAEESATRPPDTVEVTVSTHVKDDKKDLIMRASPTAKVKQLVKAWMDKWRADSHLRRGCSQRTDACAVNSLIEKHLAAHLHRGGDGGIGGLVGEKGSSYQSKWASVWYHIDSKLHEY